MSFKQLVELLEWIRLQPVEIGIQFNIELGQAADRQMLILP